MGTLVNAIVATICWLAVFRADLIRRLFYRPVGEVVTTLTGTDLLLWLATFAVVAVGMFVFDLYLRRPAPINKTRLWP